MPEVQNHSFLKITSSLLHSLFPLPDRHRGNLDPQVTGNPLPPPLWTSALSERLNGTRTKERPTNCFQIASLGRAAERDTAGIPEGWRHVQLYIPRRPDPLGTGGGRVCVCVFFMLAEKHLNMKPLILDFNHQTTTDSNFSLFSSDTVSAESRKSSFC